MFFEEMLKVVYLQIKRMKLDTIINSIYPLNQDFVNKIIDISTLISLEKGHILFRPQKSESYIYFMKKGISRAFSQNEDQEVTFWFGQEGDMLFSLRNYVEAKPSYETIELLEDCELYQLKSSDLQSLYNSYIEIANWGRKLVEKELIKAETRFISGQFKSASQRYHELIENYPSLLQRVSLGIIASYLGITQVTLSRIRAEKEK